MVPNKIDSNVTGLAYAEEATLKTLPGGPIWYGLEPNSYTDLGATYSTVARTPIVNTRQQAKGTITDLDAKGGFSIDLTQRNVTRLLQGFFFADALEKPATNKFNSAAIPFTSITLGPNKFNAAAGLGQFLTNHLVMVKGFANATNNGLTLVSGSAAGFVQTAKGLVADGAPSANATMEAVGYQFAAGDLVLTAVGATFVLTSTAIDLATLGLAVGEWLYVGGDGAGFAFAVAGRFYGRIKAINGGAAPSSIVLDLVVGAPAADGGAAKTLQIFFGKTVMNAILPANIKRRSYQLERSLGNDGDGIQAEYLLGAIPNELTLNLKQAAKVDLDLSFVGLDVASVTGLVGLKAGTRIASLAETAFNTSHDLVAMRLAIIDLASANPAALYAYATDAKIGIKNGVTPNKALAVLGAFDASAGDFSVEGTITAYFASVNAIAAVRNNADVCFTAVMAKQNAGFILDIPLLQLGNGLNKVEKDKPITVDLTTAAAQNAAGYTTLMTFFEYLPAAAMPV